VLPATGEGINSGLEDCMVLADIVSKTPENAFETFEKIRGPDIRALSRYAKYLNTSPVFSGERVARVLFMVLESSSFPKSCISESLFGVTGKLRMPYSQIVYTWEVRKLWMLGLCRLVCWPIAAAVEILYLPVRIFGWVASAIRGNGGNTRRVGLGDELKPPV
jgi:hypothetical protein